jgi:hypothetical protein
MDRVDPSKLVEELRELAARAKATGDEQQAVMEVITQAIERAKAILEREPPTAR